MIVVILKNTLLILLIVLIIHFMIKNRIMDDIDTFKRKLVHDDTLNELHNQTARQHQRVLRNVVVEEESSLSTARAKKQVRFDENEYVPECPNGLTCDDFKESEMLSSKDDENTMKELYDFVYDEVSKEQQQEGTTSLPQNTELHDFFPEGQTFETKVDKTEIDAHHQSTAQSVNNMVPNDCNYEVVGVIEVEATRGDDVYGLDTLSSTNFSSIF